MKCKKINLNEKDIEILNKVKKFLNTQDSEIEDRDITQFNRTMKWINRIFSKDEQEIECCTRKEKKHKMGYGTMKGLSGCTWDFSKMPDDQARYMKKCLERDIEHDKMMNPMKYLGSCPIRSQSEIIEEYGNYYENKTNRIIDQILNIIEEAIVDLKKNKSKDKWLPILSILIEALAEQDKKEDK